MPDRARNNSVMRRPRTLDRTVREIQPAQVGVAENQRVFGFNQRSSVPGFLNGLAEIRGEQFQLEVQDAAVESAATGETNERFQDNHLFIETVNKIRAGEASMRTLAEAEAGLERAILESVESGEPFDAEAYIDSAFNELLESPQGRNEAFRGTVMEAMIKARAQIVANAEAIESQALLAASEEAFDDFVAERVQAGPIDGETIKGFMSQADELGLTRNEAHDRITEMILGRMDATEDRETLENLHGELKGYLESADKGFLGRNESTIERVRRQAESRIDQAENEMTEAEVRAANDTIMDLRRRINFSDPAEPLPTLSELSQVREQIGETAYMRLEGQLQAAQFKRTEEARQAAEQAQINAQLDQVFDHPEAYHLLSNEHQREVTSRAEQRFFETRRDLIAAGGRARLEAEGQGPELDDDSPTAEQQMWVAVNNVGPYLRWAQQVGHKPRSLAGYFESASIGTPEFPQVARMYGMMKSRYGENPIPGMSASAVADLDQFNHWLSVGLTEEEALGALETRHDVSLDESRRALQAEASDEVADAVENIAQLSSSRWGIGEDVVAENRLAMRRAIEELAVHRFRVSQDAEASVEWATQRFLDSHEVVGSRFIPVGHGIAHGFGQVFEEQESFIVEDLRKHGVEAPESLEFIIERPGDGTSRMWLVDPDNPLRAIRDSEGNAIYLDPTDIHQGFRARMEKETEQAQREAHERGQERRQRRLQARQSQPSSNRGPAARSNRISSETQRIRSRLRDFVTDDHYDPSGIEDVVHNEWRLQYGREADRGITRVMHKLLHGWDSEPDNDNDED